MKGKKFYWDIIVKDSAEIIANDILKGKNKITTLKSLYTALEEMYKKDNREIPTSSTYRQKMHQVLNVGYNQKNVKSALYQLAGKYDKMTLNMFAENIQLSSENNADNCNWLFIRLKKYESDYTKTQKHLYFFSQELKKKFTKEIVFISFDTDTIVIMCSDINSRNKVFSYLNNISDISAFTEDN
ncbi:MAG: hypothetical protein NC177_15310 [Ruminococcus flavefaciens]|nr:hypothetical protein [Ruminococcus flavefaciens]